MCFYHKQQHYESNRSIINIPNAPVRICIVKLFKQISLLRAGRRTLHFRYGKMVIEYTMHLIWDIFFFQNLTEAIYILRFTIHLHQRNAEIITNIRNLKQQVSVGNYVDTLHILGH